MDVSTGTSHAPAPKSPVGWVKPLRKKDEDPSLPRLDEVFEPPQLRRDAECEGIGGWTHSGVTGFQHAPDPSDQFMLELRNLYFDYEWLHTAFMTSEWRFLQLELSESFSCSPSMGGRQTSIPLVLQYTMVPLQGLPLRCLYQTRFKRRMKTR